jgi:hypothetical protein
MSPVEDAKAPIIEFAGLPGAGKSTVAARFYQELLKGNVTTLSGDEIAWKRSAGFVLGTLLSQARLVLPVVNYTLNVRPLDVRRFSHSRRILTRAHALQRVQRMRPNALVVLDQGWIQEFGSTVVPGGSGRDRHVGGIVKRLAGRFLWGVVMVEVGSEVAGERVRRRATTESRFDRWPAEVVRANLPVMHRALEMAVDIAAKCGVPVLTLDGTQPPEHNSRIVSDWARDTFGIRLKREFGGGLRR